MPSSKRKKLDSRVDPAASSAAAAAVVLDAQVVAAGQRHMFGGASCMQQ